ncbi:hypothetical protein B0H13DRAFT_2361247 [Mycena leptocephala]|nr:hypothetical protein B0H13DRAFT_2361247 [Mycena leptocephala]
MVKPILYSRHLATYVRLRVHARNRRPSSLRHTALTLASVLPVARRLAGANIDSHGLAFSRIPGPVCRLRVDTIKAPVKFTRAQRQFPVCATSRLLSQSTLAMEINVHELGKYVIEHHTKSMPFLESRIEDELRLQIGEAHRKVKILAGSETKVEEPMWWQEEGAVTVSMF